MRVSVVMPTYDQDSFLPSAVGSLFAQTEQNWELIVVDDGSPGDTQAVLGHALDDPRVRLHLMPQNLGLGAALNVGMALARADVIAYLPSDDLYFATHLEDMLAAFEDSPDAILCYSGVRYGDDLRDVRGRIPGESLQLIQVAHRRTSELWLERQELTTDDLDRMLWSRLLKHGRLVTTGRVTCQWTCHPKQRSKMLREPQGGLNAYRARYRVTKPLRLKSSVGSLHDEGKLYRRFRSRPPTPPARDGLRILLVGELAFNPERVLALEERGHTLFGLWTDSPWWLNTVGPLPFGHVTDLPRQGWLDAVRRVRPHVVYALLNWQAITVAHQVLNGIREAGLPISFVWHVKEGPFHARRYGLWPQLVDLHVHSDGQIYSSPELRDWFHVTVPATRDGLSHVLDGDLPKADWLEGERSPLISDRDGQIHTVIPGRPMGPAPALIAALADRGIHVHVYGEKVHTQMRPWIEEAKRLAADHFHLHRQVDQADWVREFSLYDAGWLHTFSSSNRGDIRAATWDDLNYPARLGTLACAGVPFIQRDNTPSLVATQNLVVSRELGVLWTDVDDLAGQLHDRSHMSALRESVWRQRSSFTFDVHADELIAFFRQVIAATRGRGGAGLNHVKAGAVLGEEDA